MSRKKFDNPWMKLLILFLGVPIGGMLFLYLALLSAGGGAGEIFYIIAFIVIIYVAYRAFTHQKRMAKRERESQQDDNVNY